MDSLSRAPAHCLYRRSDRDSLVAAQDALEDMRLLAAALRRHGIPWALFGGAAARSYGVDCRLRDIDLITSASLEATDAAAPGAVPYVYGDLEGRVIGKIEIWPSPLLLDGGSTRYLFEFDAEMRARVRIASVPAVGLEMPVLAPEDLIVIKALQQRGESCGKHDMRDLRQLWEAQREVLDRGYLCSRAGRVRGLDRVERALAAAGVTETFAGPHGGAGG